MTQEAVVGMISVEITDEDANTETVVLGNSGLAVAINP